MQGVRKTTKTVLLLAALASLWLCACSTEQQIVATATPANAFQAVADTAMSTPTIGTGRPKQRAGAQILLLHSQPDQGSPLTGQVAPGERGKVLGLNAAGTWVLIDFAGKSGWAPVTALELVIER